MTQNTVIWKLMKYRKDGEKSMSEKLVLQTYQQIDNFQVDDQEKRKKS